MLTYKIGDEIIDTLSFGTVEIVDILISPTTGNTVFDLQQKETGNRFFACPIELSTN